MLVALSADGGKMHIGSPGIDCDGGGRCNAVTTIVSPPVAAHQGYRSDANGNAAGFVISSRTGARARVGIRYVARFQAYIDDLEKQSRRARVVHGRHPARRLLAVERASVRKSPRRLPAAAWRG
ncbi:MAG: hypothetical protein WBL48_12060 [Pseudolabrys sp.]